MAPKTTAPKKAAAKKPATTTKGKTLPEVLAEDGVLAEAPKTTKGATFQEAAARDNQYEGAQGYTGAVPDDTPNSAYTVAGRLGGEPTPEDDKNLARSARDTVGGKA